MTPHPTETILRAMAKLFTLEEANALLPRLREAVSRIRDARRTVFDAGKRIRASAAANGGGPDAGPYLDALKVLRVEMERLAEDEIVLRDPENGLLDFPAERDGREVFLCWKVGEDRVGFWHDPESGFAGRKPL